MLLFQKKDLEKLKFVHVSGRDQVSRSCVGLESFVYAAILFNRIKLTNKGVIRVFGSDGDYRGFIKRDENGTPKKFKPEWGDEETCFND